MSRVLKFWNGRWYPYRGQHGYVAAYSRADAVRLINELVGWKAVSDIELRDYWSDCWGNSMRDVAPERGLWVQENYAEKPKRIEASRRIAQRT